MNLVLQLGHGGLASTSSSVLSVSQASLKLPKLVVQRLLGRGLGRGVVLLSAQLIGKTSGVHHCLLRLLLSVLGSAQHGVDLSLLRLLLSVLGSAQHGVNLSLDGVDGALQSALGGHVAAVDH